LKSKISAPKPSVLLMRRGLVVFQFLTAQILIIGAIVVIRQMLYIQNRPLGFNTDKVLDLEMPDNSPAKPRALYERLSALPGISSISLSLGAPVSNNSINTNYNLQEKSKTTPLQAHIKAVDKAYLQTYGLQLVAGRWFDESDERRVAP